MDRADLERLALWYTSQGYAVDASLPDNELIDELIDAQSDWCDDNGEEDPNEEPFVEEPPPVTAAAPVAPAPEPPARPRRAFDPRCWSPLQFVLAFVLALVGLYVGAVTAGFDNFHGNGHGWFTFGWVVACVGAGFSLGGLIGYTLERWWRHR